MLMGLLWSPIALWVVVLHRSMTRAGWGESAALVVPPMVVKLFICLSTWYICKTIRLERQNPLKTLISHLLAAAAVNTLWLLLILVYSRLLDSALASQNWTQLYRQSLPLFVGVGTSLYFISALVYYLVLANQETRAAEKEALQQQLHASRAELDALKSTIHPHFLFNSLNVLGPLIRQSPKDAGAFISRLSDFLLYSLKYGSKARVTVQDELDHIQDYLAIEGVRLGERLKTAFDIDRQALPLPILPFTLLPLVENAIKHGIAQCLAGGTLSLSLKKGSHYIYIEISNPYEHAAKALKGRGHGLENLRKRLQVYYGTTARLTIDKGAAAFTAKLTIPIKEEESE